MNFLPNFEGQTWALSKLRGLLFRWPIFDHPSSPQLNDHCSTSGPAPLLWFLRTDSRQLPPASVLSPNQQNSSFLQTRRPRKASNSSHLCCSSAPAFRNIHGHCAIWRSASAQPEGVENFPFGAFSGESAWQTPKVHCGRRTTVFLRRTLETQLELCLLSPPPFQTVATALRSIFWRSAVF